MIGRLTEDGTVKYARCHYDGYIKSGVGETLHLFYKDAEKIDRLFTDCHKLPRRELQPGEHGITCVYESWDVCANIDAWLEQLLDEDYLYLYDGSQWKVAKTAANQTVRADDFKPVEEFI
jgi:hypothetical protein